MREGRRRTGMNKMLQKKLSTLTSEVLGIEIQQQLHWMDFKNNDSEDESGQGGRSLKNSSMIGHSSVEDAAAALRLYWHKCREWEHSLGYPLKPPRSSDRASSRKWPSLKMYLDGCNLPIGMRGVDFKKLIGNYAETKNDPKNHSSAMTISSPSFRLVAKATHYVVRGRNHMCDTTTTDWIPRFRSALLPGSVPTLEHIGVIFDGAKFRDITKCNANGNSGKIYGDAQTKVFCLEASGSNGTSSSNDHGSIMIEITKDRVSADDVLFDRCCTKNNNCSTYADQQSTGLIIPLEKVIDILSNQRTQSHTNSLNGKSVIDVTSENDLLSHYVVITRKAGGNKTHRRLFDKLHLRRPYEGAICLSGLTIGLQKDSLRIARELQRERGIQRVIECKLKKRVELRYVVVTDDIFLTERLIRSGVVLVLSYRQLEHMF